MHNCKHRTPRRRGVRRGLCKKCKSAQAKRWRGSAKGAAWCLKYGREWRRKNVYNMPEPTRVCPAMCECCGRPPNGRGTLHLDHVKNPKKFRGWLCSSCNRAIGYLGDSVAGVMKAVAYLRRQA